MTAEAWRFVRAAVAGGGATAADLLTLVFLVQVVGVSAHLANVPALVVGGVVNFFANRHFAFRAGHGSLARQAALYLIVELAALAANGVLFDLAMRLLPASSTWVCVPVRLITSNLVFIAWSYPLWRMVFRVPRTT